MTSELSENTDPTSISAEGKYKWCLHCERTYNDEEYRGYYDKAVNFNFKMCPHEGCDGTTVLDGWDWENVRKGREDRYPEIPEKGKVYPLYE